MAQERLNATLQESVLTLLGHSDTHGKVVAELVDPALFEGDYRVIAERCVDYWKRYGTAPKTHLDDQLSHILDDPNNRRAGTYRSILISMVQLADSINAGYVIDKLRSFVRLQQLKSAILESAEKLNRDQEVAVAEIEDVWDGLLRTRATSFEPGMRLTDYERALAYMRTLQEEFVTGVRELDLNYIVPFRKGVLLFLGAAGKGKSWFLVNVGRHALMQRMKVVHITLEMGEEQVAGRYYQNMFAITKRATKEITVPKLVRESGHEVEGIEFEKIRPEFSLSSEAVSEELRVRIHKFGRRFENIIIKRFSPRSLTVSALRGYLDTLEVTEKFIPDMVILDYVGLLKTDAANYRITLGRAFEEFRAVCVERNVAGVTAHQISRMGAESLVASSTHVAEDWSMIGTADQVIAYSCTDAEARLGLARLTVAKARDERDRFGVLITQAYPTGQFVLESAYLDPEYYEILDALKGGASDDDSTEDDD